MEKNPNAPKGENPLKLIINGKHYEFHSQYITGAEIKKLANIPDNEDLFLAIKKPWEDESILHDSRVDLAREGIEHFFSNSHLVNIYVNTNVPIPITRGKHTVDEIKKLGKVNPAYDLNQIIDGRVVPLEDGLVLSIKGEEHFTSSVKCGSSS